MKTAKSMYFGGHLVSAADCDYSDSKRLGLVCPYCSEAVFLRSGAVREQKLRSGERKTQIVNPSFAHYPNSLTSFDCENRSLTKEGRERLERIAIEARDQRLKLYNKHLWQMIKGDRLIREKVTTATCKRVYGSLRPVEVLAIASRKYWAEILACVYEAMEESLSIALSAKRPDGVPLPFGMSEDEWRRESESQQLRLTGVDLAYHRAICKEIADFLATHSGGYAFYWLTRVAIHSLTQGAGFTKRQIGEYEICLSIASLISTTNWTEVIRGELGDEMLTRWGA